jgi:large subunit ribosomal protein L24
MPKLKIKKGDAVKVIAGNYRGQQGQVLSVNPDTNKAIVEGINIVSRHTKPSAASPQGGIIKKEAPIQISNLMFLHNGTATRVGRKLEDGKIVRYAKKSGEVIK